MLFDIAENETERHEKMKQNARSELWIKLLD